MKNLRYLIPFLILALTIFYTPACAAEAEVIEEPAVEEPVVEQTEVIEEPEAEKEPVEVEEPAIEDPVTAEGEPELVWTHKHENSINSLAVDPVGEILAVGEFKVSYMHLLANGVLIDVLTHEHSVEDLEFSLDGAILGAGQGYHGILLTDLDNGEEYMTLSHTHNSRLAFPLTASISPLVTAAGLYGCGVLMMVNS